MLGELLSLIAVYNWDSTIFDDLKLPTISDLPADGPFISDPTALDKTDLIGNILSELGELNLVYSDPDTLKKMIEIWSNISFTQWLELWKTLLYDYNPIWNKDGTITDSYTASGRTDGGETHSISGSGRTDGGNETTYGRTDENQVTGYDTNSYSPNTKNLAGGKDTTTIGSMYSDSKTDTVTIGNMYSDSQSRTRTEQGNIGVTTTQRMIEEQRKIVQFNMYTYITNQFKERFCVMVY